MATNCSEYRHQGANSQPLLPRYHPHAENNLFIDGDINELEGANILQSYSNPHPSTNHITIPLRSQPLANEMAIPGILDLNSHSADPAWDLKLLDHQFHPDPGTRRPQLPQLYPANNTTMDSQDPNRDQRNYSYYQPPQAQYYTYPEPPATQQAYSPIYAASTSYSPPLLSPQPPYSPGSYQSHGQLTLTQAQYEAAQAQAEAQYAAATSQPPSQYAISDAPSSSSIEDPDVKRQRNTAASARFRAKKKQREQELQASERAKREALQRLEGKVKDLENENRFLKDLILTPKGKRKEKAKDGDEEDEGDVTEGPGERKGRKRKDGVGTK